jgi:site-specific recombinase XerD
MTELRRRMIEDMRLHGLSEGTQGTYVEAVKYLARHFNRSPDELSQEDIREFFVYLSQTRHLAKSTIRVHLFAIKFLFRHTLQRPWPVLDLMRIKCDQKLPVVLSRDQVRQVLATIDRPAARFSAVMMYACGLRVSEAVVLRPEDIDSRRMVVAVRNGKGRKDRYVPLPQSTLELLRGYWRRHRPIPWLFPNQSGTRPIRCDAVRKCIQAAARQSAINKTVGCHTLRHCYATHLLEQGLDLRSIQALLGHRSIRSTIRYLHMTASTLRNVHRSVNDLMGDL